MLFIIINFIIYFKPFFSKLLY